MSDPTQPEIVDNYQCGTQTIDDEYGYLSCGIDARLVRFCAVGAIQDVVVRDLAE